MWRSLAAVVIAWAVLSGCSTSNGPDAEAAGAPSDRADTLTRVLAELRIHLPRDSYRFEAPTTADGRELFGVLLWKLDRLQRERNVPEHEWQALDLAVEFARGRALERLRQYAEAAQAFARVEQPANLLSASATEARSIAEQFAELAAGFEAHDVARIEGRAQAWEELAWNLRGTPHESLAREENEAWEMLRVERLESEGRLEEAIEAGRQLAEQHRDSKLYGRHLIRLGDLYNAALRRARIAERVRVDSATPRSYELLLDQAFSAYELAAELRISRVRHEARARIDALLAFHEEQ